MLNQNHHDELTSLISKDLALKSNVFQGPVKDLEHLKALLTSEINRMLDNDLGALLNALYRIDIDENEVRKVLAKENPQDLAPTLSEMIIKRELQKVTLRKKYGDFT